MIKEDADEVDADVVMDVDEEDEEMYKGEAMDAAMVPLKDVPPISSLHHHRSSCFFQSCLLIQQLLLLLLPLLQLHGKTPLSALRCHQPVSKSVISLLDCFIMRPLPTRDNTHSNQYKR